MKIKSPIELIYKSIVILFLIIFIPILFFVFAFGHDMNYFEAVKIETLWSNRILFLIIVAFMLLLFAIFYLFRNVKLTRKTNFILIAGLLLASILVYFVNVEISKCIFLKQGWDVDCVLGSVYLMHFGSGIGDYAYMSSFPNNVPITYFLYRLYDFYLNYGSLRVTPEFFWVMVNCFTISITGFLCSMIVKKLTNNLIAVLAAFGLHTLCVGVTPWKTTPYTDMGALLFPTLCIFLYMYAHDAKKKYVKYILWFLILLSGFLGGLVKPSVLVVLIAIIMLEIVHLLKSIKANWKELLIKVTIILLTFFMYTSYKSYIYEQCNYVYNKDVAIAYHHYMLTGLNDLSTGGYNSNVIAFHNQFTNSEERIEAQWKEIGRIIKERGLFGNLDFWTRKMVMTFNDGAFNWGREGNYYYYAFPTFSFAPYAPLLREIFWPNFKYCGHFNTYSQLIWLFILIGIPGIAFLKNSTNKHLVTTIVLTLLGTILYLLLFESRARYLICFLPVFISASAIGFWQYFNKIYGLIQKRKKKE